MVAGDRFKQFDSSESNSNTYGYYLLHCNRCERMFYDDRYRDCAGSSITLHYHFV